MTRTSPCSFRPAATFYKEGCLARIEEELEQPISSRGLSLSSGTWFGFRDFCEKHQNQSLSESWTKVNRQEAAHFREPTVRNPKWKLGGGAEVANSDCRSDPSLLEERVAQDRGHMHHHHLLSRPKGSNAKRGTGHSGNTWLLASAMSSGDAWRLHHLHGENIRLYKPILAA